MPVAQMRSGASPTRVRAARSARAPMAWILPNIPRSPVRVAARRGPVSAIEGFPDRSRGRNVAVWVRRHGGSDMSAFLEGRPGSAPHTGPPKCHSVQGFRIRIWGSWNPWNPNPTDQESAGIRIQGSQNPRNPNPRGEKSVESESAGRRILRIRIHKSTNLRNPNPRGNNLRPGMKITLKRS